MELCVVILAVVAAAASGQDVLLSGGGSEELVCPAWYVAANGSTDCECGDTFGGAVRCDNDDQSVSVLSCFCITLNPNGQLFLSSCLFTCSVVGRADTYIPLPTNASEVTEAICGRFNRRGPLCGNCIEGHEAMAFSFHLTCVQCTESHWFQYFAMTLLPITVFFFGVVILRFRATSAWLDAYLLFSQIITSPGISRLYLLDAGKRFTELTLVSPLLVRVTQSMYGIWNLNFFQAVVPPFCIGPGFGTLYVFALEFVVGLYPLFLVLVTYTLVELHARNFKPLVVLWKPFRRVFIRFHNQVSAKNSMVDVFATFLLLSYVKLVSVSTDLLHLTLARYPNSTTTSALWFYDGTTAFFLDKHTPLGILAVGGLVFCITIVVFLFLYPCKCCQAKVMSHLPWPQMREFVDCFQGHYKDGTNGSRDYRFFSALYLLMRLVHLSINEFLFFGYLVPIGGMLALLFALLIFVFQPYRRKIHNTCNGGILLVMASWLAVVALYQFPLANLKSFFLAAVILEFVVCVVPFLYSVTLIVAFLVVKCRKWFCSKSEKKLIRSRSSKDGGWNGSGNCVDDVTSDTSYPDRVSHPERYNSIRLSGCTAGTGRTKHLKRMLLEDLQARGLGLTPTEEELEISERVSAVAIPIEEWKRVLRHDSSPTATRPTEDGQAAHHTPATPSEEDLKTNGTPSPTIHHSHCALPPTPDLGASPTVDSASDLDSDSDYVHLQDIAVDMHPHADFLSSNYNLLS